MICYTTQTNTSMGPRGIHQGCLGSWWKSSPSPFQSFSSNPGWLARGIFLKGQFCNVCVVAVYAEHIRSIWVFYISLIKFTTIRECTDINTVINRTVWAHVSRGVSSALFLACLESAFLRDLVAKLDAAVAGWEMKCLSVLQSAKCRCILVGSTA